MALYINKLEAAWRIGNGFLTKDGMLDGKMYNIYKENGIDIYDPQCAKMMKCVMSVLSSMEEDGIQIYARNFRGAKLREIRKKQGKSAASLAKESGLSRTTIYDIENGIKKPRQDTLLRIADALHIPVEKLG